MVTFYCFNDVTKVLELDKVINLIYNQMKVIGSDKSTLQIRETLLETLNKNNQSNLFVGYNSGNEPICFAFGNTCKALESKSYFWLNEIYVSNEYRQQKLGSKLLVFMENWLAKRDVELIASMTSIENIASYHLFTNNNYSVQSCFWIEKNL